MSNTQYRAALELYQRAIDSTQAANDSALKAALTALQRGQYELARGRLRRLLTDRPGYPMGVYGYGLAEYALRHYEDAYALLEMAATVDRPLYEAHLIVRGYLYQTA